MLLEFVLQDLCLDLKIGQLLPQSLGVNPQLLSFLLANLDFLLHHDCSLDRAVILVFEILK